MEEERHERAVTWVGTLGDEEVKVRVPVEQRAEGLDRGDDTGHGLALPERGAKEVAERLVRDPAQEAQEGQR